MDYEVKHYPRIDGHFAPQELKEVHPLGKSPIITVQASGAAAPITLAESGAIVEFLLKHFGPQLIPQEYQSGKDKMPGSETEEWLRYRHFMHYSEGSLMSLLVIALVAEGAFLSPRCRYGLLSNFDQISQMRRQSKASRLRF
jgi:glutathione S-transferase